MRRLAVSCLLLVACDSQSSPGDGGPDGSLADAGIDASPRRPDAGPPDPLRLDCEPLVPEVCAYPLPSSWFLTADPSRATGYRVRFGATTLPRTRAGAGRQHLPADILADSDGFSVNATILAYLEGATTAGLPSPSSIARSLDADSPTVLFDVDAGERVPHFAELDRSTARAGALATFMIRPVVPLAHGHRHIVAIRAVVDAGGAVIPATALFAALRDGTAYDHYYVESRRDDFEDIFTRLSAIGVERASLQLAWDFVTASEENDLGAMVRARDLALAAVGPDGPEYRIDMVQEDVSDDVARRIHGTMTVPLFLGSAAPGSMLHYGADGRVEQNGTAEFGFLVNVPRNASPDAPLAPLQYGHGLLGDRTQANAGWLNELANTNGYIVFAVDWVGMSSVDVSPITLAISTGEIERFRTVPDRLVQGLVNALLAMRMMRGRFARDPSMQVGGRPIIDTNRGFYTGDSQGGIFGATYMALSTDVTRGILGVPGQPYSLLLNRSVDFDPYLLLLRLALEDGPEIQIVMHLMQTMWDRAEPGSFSRHIMNDPISGTPSHQVILQVAIGDHQVTPLGAHIMARAIGARSIAPQTRPIWGIDEVDTTVTPHGGSAIVEFDFGNPPAPIENVPPRDGTDDPHGRVRRLPAALAQANRFFQTGEIVHTCTDTCDPE